MTAVPAEAAALPAAPAAAQAPAASAKAAAAKKASKIKKQRKRAAKAVKFAYAQIGDPYRYGATGPNAWDCSGLAGGAWRKAGVKLPRTTYQIYAHVKRKVRYSKLRKGDLVFFYSGRSHMGIYVGKGYMIHAPSSGKRVQKVKLSTYYKRHFNGAVRPGL
ncbi:MULTISPECIES: C40 family peptidase [Thermomonospora]|uniref:NLP/P60 protein n=1 Tax=Thermomonospora curvata (strain ATCC 19995 / DSM 43183 / JCM 3096 / KCTC 9072 / NBRC 15933 / NCIMB 10081 / Henssen B9) TaxID=471852 RepID=D1A3P0_THECD|nr:MULTISPECIES: C40 family peptidase [Thermomonospora]ACY96165.1 NLP/P60 protein [Thermomonospora curvata DSM 43183]PKK15598.1 MAG: NlpC/P60 family protein [Thermomonospora sp. CIF 1]